MKDRYTTKVKYSIEPRFKKRWFRESILVYDLVGYKEGQYWSDPSYGNGLGNFVDFEDKVVLNTFTSLEDAEKTKNEFIKTNKLWQNKK